MSRRHKSDVLLALRESYESSAAVCPLGWLNQTAVRDVHNSQCLLWSFCRNDDQRTRFPGRRPMTETPRLDNNAQATQSACRRVAARWAEE